MTIRIECFGSLREQPGIAALEFPLELELRAGMTIADAWRAVSERPPPANVLCARNHEYAAFHQPLEEGDEVAFFPPVTGG